jgi:protein phosphatase
VALVETSHSLFLAVADGVSGQRSAAEASQAVLKTLCRKIKATKKSSLRNTILDALELANLKILQKGRGAGSTLACVEICDEFIRPYLVGDSSVILVGQKGKLRYRNIAHSPVGYGLASGLLEESEALDHEENHLLMNAIGGADLAIDLGPKLSIQDLDTLLLCSDGLTDLLPLDVILESIRKGEINEALQSLLSQVETRLQGSEEMADDLSIILYRRSASQNP